MDFIKINTIKTPNDEEALNQDETIIKIHAAVKKYDVINEFKFELEENEMESLTPSLLEKIKKFKDLKLCETLYALTKLPCFDNHIDLYDIRGQIRTAAFSIWKEQYKNRRHLSLC